DNPMKRRRDILGGLIGAMIGSFLLGFIPSLRSVWVMLLFLVNLFIGYIALLAHSRRHVRIARIAATRAPPATGTTRVGVARGLWVLMAELATAPEHRDKLVPEQTQVTTAMVTQLEELIDDITGRFQTPTEFVVPGQTPIAAYLDLARPVVRRAERRALAVAA